MITFKMLLVENGAIGAQKGISLGATTTIIANTIDLTSRFDINIHSRLGGGCSAGEFAWRNIGMARKVNTANTFRMSMVGVMMGDWVVGMMGVRGTIAGSGMGRMVGNMFVGVVCTMGEIWFTTWTFEFSWGAIAGFGCSISRSGFRFRWSIAGSGCRFMICRFWRWRSIRCRFMVGRCRRYVGGRGGGMVGCRMDRCRWYIGCGFMVSGCRRDIGGRSRGMIRCNFRS